MGFLKPQTLFKAAKWPEWKKAHNCSKNLLEECLPGKNPRIKFQKVSPVEDKHPKITAKIIKYYSERVLRTRNMDYTALEISNFRKCSNNFVEMFERNRYKSQSATKAFYFVDEIFNCVEKMRGGLDPTKCGVWLFGLDNFFQRNVEPYFKDKSLINSLRVTPQKKGGRSNSAVRNSRIEDSLTFL